MIARRVRATLLCQNRTHDRLSSLLSRVDSMCPVDSRLSPPGAHVLGDPASTPPIAYSYTDLPARLPGLSVVACRSGCLTHLPTSTPGRPRGMGPWRAPLTLLHLCVARYHSRRSLLQMRRRLCVPLHATEPHVRTVARAPAPTAAPPPPSPFRPEPSPPPPIWEGWKDLILRPSLSQTPRDPR